MTLLLLVTFALCACAFVTVFVLGPMCDMSPMVTAARTWRFIRTKVRRMRGGGLPHELYPELMWWEPDDKLRRGTNYFADRVEYRGVTPDGQIVFDEGFTTRVVSLDKFMWRAVNMSRQKRRVEAKADSDYMQILADTRKALREAGIGQ